MADPDVSTCPFFCMNIANITQVRLITRLENRREFTQMADFDGEISMERIRRNQLQDQGGPEGVPVLMGDKPTDVLEIKFRVPLRLGTWLQVQNYR